MKTLYHYRTIGDREVYRRLLPTDHWSYIIYTKKKRYRAITARGALMSKISKERIDEIFIIKAGDE